MLHTDIYIAFWLLIALRVLHSTLWGWRHLVNNLHTVAKMAAAILRPRAPAALRHCSKNREKDSALVLLLLPILCRAAFIRRFHVYQHVTSFSHMRSALVGKRTTATSFHRQNTGNVFANTLEYWSKYTNILNPTLREDRPVEVWQIVRSVYVRFKKAAGRT